MAGHNQVLEQRHAPAFIANASSSIEWYFMVLMFRLKKLSCAITTDLAPLSTWDLAEQIVTLERRQSCHKTSCSSSAHVTECTTLFSPYIIREEAAAAAAHCVDKVL